MEILQQCNVSVLVVSPLVSIEQDQILEAESLGISCCSLKSLKMAVDIAWPKLIFTSAGELQDPSFHRILKDPNSSLNKGLDLIVVDESHTIETWTGAREVKGREAKAFRAAYGELSTLRSLCRQGTPVLALTGTADKKTRKTIQDKLVLRNPTIIKMSPNRENIQFSVLKVKKDEIYCHLDWLVKSIKEKGETMEKTIIFCNIMTDIACVINYLMLKLGKSAYSPEDSSCPGDCLLGIYHSSSWQKNKDRVIKAFKGQGKLRVVVASSALSMGVNFPDVRYIMNWGPPRNILDFHQEAGRAGRDNKPSHVFLMYHGSQASHCEEPIKEFLNAEESNCLRMAAYHALDDNIQALSPGHQCCSFCTQNCNCKGKQLCDYVPNNQGKTATGSYNDAALSRPVTESDKNCLEDALKEIQLEMTAGVLLDKVSSHGFSNQPITDVVKNCSKLFTVHDVIETCPVFSLMHAIKILDIIQEVFQDIPNFDESMEMLQMTNVKAQLTHINMMESLRNMLEEVCMEEVAQDDYEYEYDELTEVLT